MGPLPLNIGKINSCMAPAQVLAVGGVQCTSCTECDVVLVACITDAAPILTEREYMHGGAHGVTSILILPHQCGNIVVGSTTKIVCNFRCHRIVCHNAYQGSHNNDHLVIQHTIHLNA